jgi:integrase
MTPYSGFGKSKAALDKAVLKMMKKQAKKGAKVRPLPNWTLHDLRRTAKTLMVRAGVRPDISERVLACRCGAVCRCMINHDPCRLCRC